MKLDIENFQSIEKTSLEFNPGVNLIVGPTNSGKTAIMRALQGVLLNYRGNVKKYITHFKKHIKVDLALDKDSTYTWLRGEKETVYSVTDNKTRETSNYEKAGNNNLFDYVDDLPFVYRDKQLVNLYTEKDGLPFPFNLNDVEMFKMFEELYNVSSSAAIFKFMKRLETQTNSSITQHKESIVKDKDRIDAIIELEDKYDLDKLESLKNVADKIQAGMVGIDEDISIARNNNRTSKAIKEILEMAMDPEDTSKKQKTLENLIDDLDVIQKDIRNVNSNSKLEDIIVYKKEFDTALIDSYNALYSDFITIKELESDLNSLDEEEVELQEELKEIKDKLADVDVCPLCGSKLKENK